MTLASAPSEARLLSAGWAGFIILGIIAVVIASGVSVGPVTLLIACVGCLFAYHYPYTTYGLLLALIPLMGLNVSISTGEFTIGRAFGGSIDVWAAEVVAAVLMATWAFKIIWLWWRRNDINWKPWMPLFWPMMAIVATHILSATSLFQPDAFFVVKYALRPVLWCYLVYVALTANFIRSRRILVMALTVLMVMGTLSALMGLVSLGVPSDSAFPRARPLSFFGFMPLGDNHNLLAEWLAVTIPSTIALILLLPARLARARRLITAAMTLQLIVALLTFARTVWIVLSVQALAAAFFVWRAQAEQWLRKALVGLVFLLPIAAIMLTVSSTAQVASSTSTRLMLTQISLTMWQASPWVGMGAGTFVERVGSTWIFVTEHGAPLDSHGLIQKLLAETGVFGLAAFIFFVFMATRLALRARSHFHGATLQAFTILMLSAGGAIIYQLFNTNYWSGKMWLPIGLMVAASRALMPPKEN